jgi:hypothetical protein
MCFGALDSEFRVISAADENAGRGLTIQHLHCSELSRWPGDAQATLAGLRAALAPNGELVIESTPNGAYGCFYQEWIRAVHQQDPHGITSHFFPWWMERSYVSQPASDLNAEEQHLTEQHGLNLRESAFEDSSKRPIEDCGCRSLRKMRRIASARRVSACSMSKLLSIGLGNYRRHGR